MTIDYPILQQTCSIKRKNNTRKQNTTQKTKNYLPLNRSP